MSHTYKTTGERFLRYFENNNLKDSKQYRLAQKEIEQGKYYTESQNDVYRENMMAENFKREYDKLKDESIMGIYGAAHTNLEGKVLATQTVPCMEKQLKKHYGNIVHSEDLSQVIEPYRVDTITVDGNDYEASYFGKIDIGNSQPYTYMEFWRLENAYEDLKDRL